MLRIDGDYPAAHPKGKFFQLENCKKSTKNIHRKTYFT